MKSWGGNRAIMLKARWREDEARQNLDWWRDYFGQVRECDFLMGRTDGSRGPFSCDLEWLVRPNNMPKVLEGKYKGNGKFEDEEDKEAAEARRKLSEARKRRRAAQAATGTPH